jgi:hypothetical protein
MNRLMSDPMNPESVRSDPAKTDVDGPPGRPPAPSEEEIEGADLASLTEEAAIERHKDGTTPAEDAGAETNPSAAD